MSPIPHKYRQIHYDQPIPITQPFKSAVCIKFSHKLRMRIKDNKTGTDNSVDRAIVFVWDQARLSEFLPGSHLDFQ